MPPCAGFPLDRDRDPKTAREALVVRLPHQDRIMDPRLRNRQVATDKTARQEKNGAAEDAVIINTLAAGCYRRLEDAKRRDRGNACLPERRVKASGGPRCANLRSPGS